MIVVVVLHGRWRIPGTDGRTFYNAPTPTPIPSNNAYTLPPNGLCIRPMLPLTDWCCKEIPSSDDGTVEKTTGPEEKIKGEDQEWWYWTRLWRVTTGSLMRELGQPDELDTGMSTYNRKAENRKKKEQKKREYNISCLLSSTNTTLVFLTWVNSFWWVAIESALILWFTSYNILVLFTASYNVQLSPLPCRLLCKKTDSLVKLYALSVNSHQTI